MARFYVSGEGSAQTQATRQGSARSGIRSHTRGWGLGIRVLGYALNDEQDEFQVNITSGSNGHSPDVFALTVRSLPDGGFEVVETGDVLYEEEE